MDESQTPDIRKARRAKVIMRAELESGDQTVEVRLRDLSSTGALVEAENLPDQDVPVVLRKGDITAKGHVAWSMGGKAGISFAKALPEAQLMRHIPAPKAVVETKFAGRPGLRSSRLTAQEKVATQWYLQTGIDATLR